MTLTEAQRLEIYELVKQSSLGKEGAALVMEAMPHVDWTALATHDDLAILRAELRGEMAEVKGEIAGVRGELREFRGEMRSEIRSMESGLQRSMVTWILAAQGVTLAAISALIALVAFLIA